MAGRRVLIVDNDAVLLRSLREQITAQDDIAAVETTADFAEGLAWAQSKRFDVVLVSGDAETGGWAFVQALRMAQVMWPVLILTGETEAETPDCPGIIDVVVKPFRMASLLSRLRALIRIFENSDEAVLSIGPYAFQLASKHLTDDQNGQIIRLTEKEAAILKYLYRAGLTVVPRDVLLHEVWGYNPAVTTHTLETHVYRLRQKIEKDPSDAQILVTESGGYRLVP